MISIIIPTLNEQTYLPRLLASIKQQDYCDYEIIVADAGSTDSTRSIAVSSGCRLVQGGRPAAGRNRGAEIAKGHLLLFLDADITLPPDFLSKTITEFEKRHLGIAGFDIVLVGGRVFDTLINRGYRLFAFAFQRICPQSQMAIMAHKEAHQKIGGFDESIVLLEDFCYVGAMRKVSCYGYIRQSIFFNDRRYRQDGWIIYPKYVLAEFYTIFIGPIRSDMFKYKFNHYKKNK